jgi:hypothetical protein
MRYRNAYSCGRSCPTRVQKVGDFEYIAGRRLKLSILGVSLITQTLYLVVFGVRYMDLLWTPPSFSIWNFVLKIFYITSSAYIVFLMMRVYARTREREKAWKLGAYSLGGSLLAAPLVCLIYEGTKNWGIFESCEYVCPDKTQLC